MHGHTHIRTITVHTYVPSQYTHTYHHSTHIRTIRFKCVVIIQLDLPGYSFLMLALLEGDGGRVGDEVGMGRGWDGVGWGWDGDGVGWGRVGRGWGGVGWGWGGDGTIQHVKCVYR